jgi:two-component system, LuxR family, response regulator FixJ
MLQGTRFNMTYMRQWTDQDSGVGYNRLLHPAQPDIIKSESLGLSYIYVIDTDSKGRASLHTKMCVRANTVVFTYRSAEDFLDQRDALDSGCVLLSVQGYDDVTHEALCLLQRDHRFACVVLSYDGDVPSAIRAMKAGATDFLLRPCPGEDVWHAVDEAMDSIRQIQAIKAATTRAQERIARLSMREREVLHGLIEGKSNKMIAIELVISPRTVEIYRAHLMEKLGVHSLSEVLKIAFCAGADALSPREQLLRMGI